MHFASNPPTEGGASLVAENWARFGFRLGRHNENLIDNIDSEAGKRLHAKLLAFQDGETLAQPLMDEEIEAVAVARQVQKKRGTWWQLPKHLPDVGEK